jgi:DNA-binding response OmpR family regulator
MSLILVVDDEINVRKLYEEELKDEGYDVVCAEDVKGAVDSVEKDSPDLIILDIKLGEESGIDALVQIAERRKDIPIILNSAYSVYKGNFTTWAADAYIVKSVDLGPLKEKVRELLQKQK